jgi:hypothetical protein
MLVIDYLASVNVNEKSLVLLLDHVRFGSVPLKKASTFCDWLSLSVYGPAMMFLALLCGGTVVFDRSSQVGGGVTTPYATQAVGSNADPFEGPAEQVA